MLVYQRVLVAISYHQQIGIRCNGAADPENVPRRFGVGSQSWEDPEARGYEIEKYQHIYEFWTTQLNTNEWICNKEALIGGLEHLDY